MFSAIWTETISCCWGCDFWATAERCVDGPRNKARRGCDCLTPSHTISNVETHTRGLLLLTHSIWLFLFIDWFSSKKHPISRREHLCLWNYSLLECAHTCTLTHTHTHTKSHIPCQSPSRTTLEDLEDKITHSLPVSQTRCSSNADRKPPPKILSTHKLSPRQTHTCTHTHLNTQQSERLFYLPIHMREAGRFFSVCIVSLIAALCCSQLFQSVQCAYVCEKWKRLSGTLWRPYSSPRAPPTATTFGLDTVDMPNNETGGWERDRKLWMHLHLPELFTRLSAFVAACSFTTAFPSAWPASAGKTTNQSSHFFLPLCSVTPLPSLFPLC